MPSPDDVGPTPGTCAPQGTSTAIAAAHPVWSRSDWLVVLVPVLVSAVYIRPFVTSYFPMQEGWFQHFALMVSEGQKPYVDFSFPLPPLSLLQYMLLGWFEDARYTGPRYYGALELLLLAGVSFAVLRLVASQAAALVGCLAGLAIYLANTNDTVTSYYQTTLLLVLVSLLMVVRARGAQSHFSTALLYLGGGAAGSAATLVKQTSLPVVLALAVACVLWRGAPSPTREGGWQWCAVGVLAVYVPMISWLVAMGAADEAIRQVLGGGGKGSLASLLFAFLPRVVTPGVVLAVLAGVVTGALALMRRDVSGRSVAVRVAAAVLATGAAALLLIVAVNDVDSRLQREAVLVAIAAAAVTGGLRFTTPPPISGRRLPRLWVFVAVPALAVAVVLLGQGKAGSGGRTGELVLLGREERPALVGVVFVLLLSVLACLLVMRFIPRGAHLVPGLTDVPPALPLTATVAAAWAWSHGLSGSLEVHGLLVAVGLLAALLFDQMWRSAGVAGGAVVMSAVLGLLGLSSVSRASVPYVWWGWETASVAAPHRTLQVPQLEGFDVPVSDADFLERLITGVRGIAGPGSSAYVFPFMPAVYDLTGTRAEVRCQVPYFDICSDVDASADALSLRSAPPEVIVYADMPESVWRLHEELFRSGARSGQRDIELVVEHFIQSGAYAVVDTLETPSADPAFAWKVLVLHRSDLRGAP